MTDRTEYMRTHRQHKPTLHFCAWHKCRRPFEGRANRKYCSVHCGQADWGEKHRPAARWQFAVMAEQDEAEQLELIPAKRRPTIRTHYGYPPFGACPCPECRGRARAATLARVQMQMTAPAGAGGD